jgi:hypothetical protein
MLAQGVSPGKRSPLPVPTLSVHPLPVRGERAGVRGRLDQPTARAVGHLIPPVCRRAHFFIELLTQDTGLELHLN